MKDNPLNASLQAVQLANSLRLLQIPLRQNLRFHRGMYAGYICPT